MSSVPESKRLSLNECKKILNADGLLYTDEEIIKLRDFLYHLNQPGLIAVSLMLVFYALEKRSHWFIIMFSFSCLLGSTYGFLQGAWPFGIVESIWSLIAFRRWLKER